MPCQLEAFAERTDVPNEEEGTLRQRPPDCSGIARSAAPGAPACQPHNLVGQSLCARTQTRILIPCLCRIFCGPGPRTSCHLGWDPSPVSRLGRVTLDNKSLVSFPAHGRASCSPASRAWLPGPASWGASLRSLPGSPTLVLRAALYFQTTCSSGRLSQP